MSELVSQHPHRLERHHIEGVVDVYDSNRDLILGRLVNIHHEGLMVMGAGLLLADHIYQVDLLLPSVTEGSDRLHLGIDCLWSRLDEATNSHWAGCQVIDLSDFSRRQIDALVGAQ